MVDKASGGEVIPVRLHVRIDHSVVGEHVRLSLALSNGFEPSTFPQTTGYSGH